MLALVWETLWPVTVLFSAEAEFASAEAVFASLEAIIPAFRVRPSPAEVKLCSVELQAAFPAARAIVPEQVTAREAAAKASQPGEVDSDSS